MAQCRQVLNVPILCLVRISSGSPSSTRKDWGTEGWIPKRSVRKGTSASQASLLGSSPSGPTQPFRRLPGRRRAGAEPKGPARLLPVRPPADQAGASPRQSAPPQTGRTPY